MPIIPIGVPIPQPPWPQPGPPPPGGDQLKDCCWEVNANLAIIQAQLAGMQTDPTCCTNVVTAINSVSGSLSQIAGILPTLAPGVAPPIDLTAIIAQLQAIVTGLAAIPAQEAADTGTLSANLSSIATAIQAITPADLKSVTDAITSLFNTLDVPQAVYSQLATDGFMSGADAQLSAPGALGSGLVIGLFKHLWYGLVYYIKQFTGVDLNTGVYTPAADSTAQKALTAVLKDFLAVEDAIFYPPLKPLIDALTTQLKSPRPPTIGDTGVDPTIPIASAAGVALTAGFVGWLVSYFGIAGGEPLAHVAELLAGLIGFEELRDVEIGPLIQFGIARDAEHAAKARFTQELPGNGEITGWVARGLYDTGKATTTMLFNGLHPDYHDAARTAAQAGIQPRQLIRLMNTGLFTPADFTDELTFAGLRPASQSRYQLAAPFLATTTERSKLVSALESAYAAGLYSDNDFTSLVDSAYQNTNRDSLLLTAGQIKALERDTKDLEASYADQYLGGLIDQASLQSSLEGIGLQPHFVSARMAVLEAKAAAKIAHAAAVAAARLATATAAVERRTALQNFESGVLNLAGYVAALILTGLTPVQAAAWGDLAVLKQAGNLQWKYGLLLPRSQAAILGNQVTAIIDQLKTQLITSAAAATQLSNLKLPATYVNALIAAADASAVVKKAAAFYPVLPS